MLSAALFFLWLAVALYFSAYYFNDSLFGLNHTKMTKAWKLSLVIGAGLLAIYIGSGQ